MRFFSDEDSRSQSASADKRGKYSELYKIGSFSKHNESSGSSPKSKCNDSPKGGASLSPSSSGNKVSLYELGIPQSYIRPTKRKRKSRHLDEGPNRGVNSATSFNEESKLTVKRRNDAPTSPDAVKDRSKVFSSKGALVRHVFFIDCKYPEHVMQERVSHLGRLNIISDSKRALVFCDPLLFF